MMTVGLMNDGAELSDFRSALFATVRNISDLFSPFIHYNFCQSGSF